MVGLHPQGLEQISLISHKEATQVQHCSASFGTEHSCFTGGLQRRAWGGIRGRLEMQTEHSQLCQWFAALLPTGRTTAPLETTQDRESDGQKLLLDSQQAAIECPTVRAARRAQVSHQLVSRTCKSIWRSFLKSGEPLQHQPAPSTLCPTLSDPTVLYLRPQRVCTGSSTIHTCQLCHLEGTAEAQEQFWRSN